MIHQITIHCPYCAKQLGQMDSKAIAHTWCRKCSLTNKEIWEQSANFIRNCKLEHGSFFFALYINPNQLEGTKMSESTRKLLETLDEVELPAPDDLIKLHTLLQEPENKAQILCTPEDISTLHRILERVAEQSLQPKPRATRAKKESVSWEEALRLADEEDDI